MTNVLAPFARAVRRADPSADVVGGSTVGVSVGYWKGIIAADGLRWLDAAAIHPYTGHNRSWEEDGTISQLRALRDLLKRDGAPIPIWNTEHAWWSNGPANLLRQADNSARAVLWMRAFGIDRWAYFIPEGGWGDHGVSFSAIQLDSFVKPAALAIMTAENQVAGRPFLGEVDTGFPSAYALRFGPRAGDANSGELIAAWTDSVRLPVVVSSGADRAVRLTRALGAVHQLAVGDGTQLMLDSDPVYFAVQGQGRLQLQAQETAGANLALRSGGATVAASSANATNPASAAVDGMDHENSGGELPGLPMWVSAPGDSRPSLTVTLKDPRPVNRIVVSTHSLGNTVPGLREYDLQVRASPSDSWQTVAEVRSQFHHRKRVVTFPARTVSQVKLTVLRVYYGGYNGGERHGGWKTDAASLANPKWHWYGLAVVSEIAVYAPGKVTSTPKATDGGAGPLTGASKPERPTNVRQPGAPTPSTPPRPVSPKPSLSKPTKRTVTITRKPTKVRLGSAFALHALVRPATNGVLTVQRLTRSGWKDISPGRSHAGRSSLRVVLHTRGRHSLRVAARPTASHPRVASDPVAILVR